MMLEGVSLPFPTVDLRVSGNTSTKMTRKTPL